MISLLQEAVTIAADEHTESVASSVAHGETETTTGLPQLDLSTFANQIFWLVVAMVVLYWVVAKIALPRIGAVLSDRQGAMTGDLMAAEEFKLKAKEAEAAYDKALADARAEANKIVAANRAEMQAELDAGALKVIGEAREGGNVGLFRSTGEVRSGLVEEILTKIPSERIIWEAPQKAQQVWFIKLLGANVNLGNIAPNEIVSLETIRLGLRGDTFSHFLDMAAVDPMFQSSVKSGRPGTSMPRG